MALSITITEEQGFDFLAEFDKLGKDQQCIWRACVWWKNRFPLAFPSQARIAAKVGCCREHVNRAISKFKKFGWISLGSRGPKRSKYMIIPLHLLQFDLVKREYFRRVEITSKVTHSYSRSPKIASRDGPSAFRPLDIPLWLLNQPFSHDSKLKLSLLPENIYKETVYQWKKKAQMGFRADNPEQYFVGAAFKIAEKQGIKVNWPSYYNFKNKQQRNI